MAEMGLDIGGHVSRRIASGDLDVDLVVAMTRIHAGAVIGRDSELRSRVFLPSEFSRLATDSPSMGLTTPSRAAMRERIEAIGAKREGNLVGRPAEEIDDPAGEPLAAYRATAARLDRHLSSLVDALEEVGRPAEPRIRANGLDRPKVDVNLRWKVKKDEPMYDLLIRNGVIVDGTGTDRYLGDVAVKEGRIAAVGPEAWKCKADKEIDAAGCIVIPGFR